MTVFGVAAFKPEACLRLSVVQLPWYWRVYNSLGAAFWWCYDGFGLFR